MRRVIFPFAAVLGQENVKNALIWNLVNPAVGGVLISGEKGTAKSTLVRGLAWLTGDMKIVELPLNVTEDRLVGAVDFKRAMQDGKSVLEPGILKEADGNILYVDEVNLLSDYIVNALLETAASKQNVVEREGVSCVHSSDFVLVGSMNQEEGKLRSQFLDRFGLYVEVEGEKDPAVRIEIMKRRLDYEKDPVGFAEMYEGETEILRKKIEKGRQLLPEVEITENALGLAASLSSQANCAGHRGEIAVIETARAIAAYDGRRMINTDDIKEAAKYALAHRSMEEEREPGKQPDDVSSPDDSREEENEENTPAEDSEGTSDQDGQQEEGAEEEDDGSGQESQEEGSGEKNENSGEKDENSGEYSGGDGNDSGYDGQGEEHTDENNEASEEIQEAGEAFVIPRWQDAPQNRIVSKGSGRRKRVLSGSRQGRYVAYRAAGDEKVTDLALDATIRAAAPFQQVRDRQKRAIAIEKSDMRIKIREKRTGGCILFVVDASASMGANKRMKEVKAAILSLLNVSYQKRDRVGLIAFRKDKAELLLGITRSVDLAQKKLEQLPTGGKTPLGAGLDLAYEVVMGLLMREPDAQPTIVLVSDGRANGKKEKNSNPFDQALKSAERIGNQKINTIILDTENDFIKFHLCSKLNEKLHGTLLTMEELQAEGIVEAVSMYQQQR